MSQSTHQIRVQAKDQTSAAFGSIKSRAAATGAQIRSMLGGALAAAGAYLGFRSVKAGIDELGHLSDIAQKTSTSVGELTQTAAAMSALGIQNMGVDQLAKSFDYMAKTTGRTGMAGFYETIGEIGKVEDVAQRAQMAMKVFGRSGMELLPIINAADTSVEALQTVVNALPKVPQSAADAGDAVSDAMGFAANQVKSIWLQGLGSICGWFDNEYVGGVREASLAAGNYLEYYTKVSVAKCINWYGKFCQSFKGIGEVVGSFFGAFSANAKWYDWLKLTNPGSIAADFIVKSFTGKETALTEAFSVAKDAFASALEEYDDVASDLDRTEAERTARFERAFKDREIAIQKFQNAYDNAAISIDKRKSKDGLAASDSGLSLSAPQVRNELILGGNEANRVALLGPQLQSETKRQTKILEEIRDGISGVEKNTDPKNDEFIEFN